MNTKLTREGRVRAREFMDTFRWPAVIVVLFLCALLAAPAHAASVLKVERAGLGDGTVTSSPAGLITCGADCDENFATTTTVVLTATAPAGSVFVGWQGDCAGAIATCSLSMSANRSVHAEFRLDPDIPLLVDTTPGGIQDYLNLNPNVDTAARFVRALRTEFKQGWILMTRSESLQTGTAKFPRILMPSADAQRTFSLGLSEHASYPGASPNAVEYMIWDGTHKTFSFNEIVLKDIPAMGEFPARGRGVLDEEARCTRCHSTRNINNPSATDIGTTTQGTGFTTAKNKPNWDTYDSWGGAMPFNRDRIYQGSLEAASFRALLNPWTWRDNEGARQVIEQLALQPPGVPVNDVITRTNGGTNDGHVNFSFDTGVVLTEPAPVGVTTPSINYGFNGVPGVGPGTTVQRDGPHIVLHAVDTPLNDEGRAVQFFDLLGGADGNLNQTRVGSELSLHRYITGSIPLDTRPVSLAITKGCLNVNAAGNNVTPSTGTLTFDQAFFSSRHGGLTLNDIVANTLSRRQSLPRRKADIEKFNLDRDGDVYLIAPSSPEIDLIEHYGAATAAGTSTGVDRLRQEVFRRPIDAGSPDSVIGGFYVDREIYGATNDKIALYRYLLEPLGVSVDKWSMGVRGRSRTFTFADIFPTYTAPITNELETSLNSDPFPGLAAPYDCAGLVTAVNSALAVLPAYQDVPRYTDVQRVFNKSCIECHGGLGYPPFADFFPANYLNFSEEDSPASGNRLTRSYGYASSFVTADPATSYLYQRITDTTEACPYGLMPCGGPQLVKADIETIRRWIVGGAPNTSGDPHITTMNGVPYDFQSAGEFTLLRAEDMEVQTRQTPVEADAPLAPNAHTGLSSCPSINTAAAVRVGTHRITYQPNASGQPDPSGLQLRVDGKLVEKMGARGILLPDGGRILPTTAPGGIQIEYPGGTDIVITPSWWAYYQVWWLSIDVRHARGNQGVMGTIEPNQWLPALGDDSFLGVRPAALTSRYKQLYGKFADSWRVNGQTSLFDYASGTSTATYTLPGWPAYEPQTCKLPPGWAPKVAPPKPLPAETAKKLCGAVVDAQRRANCEQDVTTTGEPGFATNYLAAEKIQRNSIPPAPVLTAPEKSKVGLGDTVSFTWQPVKDKDGGKLTYLHCVWPAGARQTFRDCRELGASAAGTAVSGLKAGQAYFWKVVIDDAQGGTVESETRRFATK